MKDRILDLCESLAGYVDMRRELVLDEAGEPFWGGTIGVDGDSIQWYEPIESLYRELDFFIRTASPLQCERVLESERFLTIENDLHLLRAAYENDKELVQARSILQNRAMAGRSQIDNLLIQELYWALPRELRGALLGKQHILVAGSGPLPITGINITQMGTRVTCLERDPKAFFIGEQIIHLAGHVIDSINYDIMDLDNFDQYDAIVGVVLLGICPSARRNYKAEVIQHILTNVRRGTTVALRVPHGLGQLLYPSVELDSIEGFDIKRTVPEIGINNSYRSAIITAHKL